MKHVLIAEAGATKTDWSLLKHKSDPIRLQSIGINPAQDTQNDIKIILEKVKDQLIGQEIDSIYFFGAGCATPLLRLKIIEALKDVFKIDSIEVESDLKAAALALFGDSQGIACILGTGSASGLFSEGQLISQIPSLGYILGDEGSGMALGKRLLNSVFKNQLSHELSLKFQQEYNISLPILIDNVYGQRKPAKYLASFAPFLLKNIENEEIKALVEVEFDVFFKRNILSYTNSKDINIGFVGSVAWHFQDIIKKRAEKYGLKIASILKTPMPHLEIFLI